MPFAVGLCGLFLNSYAFISGDDDEVLIKVYVQPKSTIRGVVGTFNKQLKIRLMSPPTGGKANKELCRFLSHFLGTKKSNVILVKGACSRNKIIAVRNVGKSEIIGALAEELA